MFSRANVLLLLVLASTVPNTSHGEQDDSNEELYAQDDADDADVYRSTLEGGIQTAYHAPKPSCPGFMPYAQCAHRCTPSRSIVGAEDCSHCTLYRFMPPASCAQCSASRPCNSAFAYKLLPVNECRIRPEYRPTKKFEYAPTASTTKPITNAPTTTYTSTTKSSSVPVPEPTKYVPAPKPVVTKPMYGATQKPTQAPTETPATKKPVYHQTPKPTTMKPTFAPATKAPTTAPTYASTSPPVTYRPTQPTVYYTPKPTTDQSAQSSSTNPGTAKSAAAISSKGLAGGQNTGIVIGCLLAVCLTAFFVYRKFMSKKQEEQMFGESAMLEDPASTGDYASM